MTPTHSRLEWALVVGALALGAWLVWRGTRAIDDGPGSKLNGPTSTSLEPALGDE
jgi:hypothetical protein